MESVNNTRESHLLEDQSTRPKRTLIISLVIVLKLIIGSIILVFTILKQEAEFQSLSAANPIKAIEAACSLTPYPNPCVNSIWHLQRITPSANKLNASAIFRLSLNASFNGITNIISGIQIEISRANNSRTLSALKDCEISLHDSLRLINMSITRMADKRPDGKNFNETKSAGELEKWLSNAKADIDRCLTDYERFNYIGNFVTNDHAVNNTVNFDQGRIRRRMFLAKSYVENSFAILRNMDTIHSVFNQPNINMFSQPKIKSMIADFVFSSLHFAFGIGFYCSQYLMLVVLLCMVLRLK